MDKTEGEAWHQHGIFDIVRSTERLCFYNKILSSRHLRFAVSRLYLTSSAGR